MYVLGCYRQYWICACNKQTPRTMKDKKLYKNCVRYIFFTGSHFSTFSYNSGEYDSMKIF